MPSLSRRCLAHRVGTHSPRLHFCREPNLYRAGENHSVAAGSALFLWETTPRTPSASVTENVAYNQERPISAFLAIYPCKTILGVGVYGGNPTNRSLWRCANDWSRTNLIGATKPPINTYLSTFGAKEWNRTTDLPLMRRTFLPTELLGHM